jgi:hypothetical protein
MKNLISMILVLSIVPLSACRETDLGTGTNTVDREYSKPAPEACKAALQSAESADFKVLSDKHDQLGGELVVSRGDGKEVRILVKSLDEKSSRVSVRVEPGDRDLANLMHERIAGNLGMGTATAGWWFGGNSLDATYPTDLASCMTSARRTIVSLAQNSKDEVTHATWCQIDGRLKDSTPVRIKMERLEDKKTGVRFIVGNTKSEDNKAFAQKMKDEFETTTRPAGGGGGGQ